MNLQDLSQQMAKHGFELNVDIIQEAVDKKILTKKSENVDFYPTKIFCI